MSNDWEEAKRKFEEMMEEMGLDSPSPWPPSKSEQPEYEIPDAGTVRRESDNERQNWNQG